ncbi:alpha-related fimbriae chaperone 2 [Yersinia intermedia]|jgi:hypothetical protein|uniref:Alpha-related fimbriae chaperone 2 n=1 Tax=Yersinia intermedia TaxID=631 RepID=A0A0T9MIU0_YERIN|nr:hypothetical protein [Yersinia intermedia]AJJ20049.1 hypothetical protein CH53_2040 [Yersinia intermedia]MCB5300120.1 hypothetical protein [Yersinia intermedia]MCW8112176.1 hypothetical protein [Yersinia intermedia]MDA5481236.1 hypothetical protein [Yersinia intermedia]MDA5491829.1 hypothetical protein [Yersinia intermedia]
MKRLLFIATSLLPLSVFSAIDIQPHVLEIEQENTVVTVTNYGLDPEYVAVQLYQLNNPGESPEQESLTSVGEQPQPALFASPAKLTLGPKQSGRIFLKALSTPDKEQVYRLAVVPVNNLQVTGGHTAVLGVQLSYMGLVRHLAASPQPQWAHRCIDGRVELQNTGNTRLQWRQLKTQEQDIEGFNLYPDQRRQLSVSDVRGMIEDKPFNLRCIAG